MTDLNQLCRYFLENEVVVDCCCVHVGVIDTVTAVTVTVTVTAAAPPPLQAV